MHHGGIVFLWRLFIQYCLEVLPEASVLLLPVLSLSPLGLREQASNEGCLPKLLFWFKESFSSFKRKRREKGERERKPNTYYCFPWELEAETELTCGLYWGETKNKSYEYRDNIWELTVTAMFLLAFLPNVTLIVYMFFSTRFPQFSWFPESSFNGSANRVL